MARDWRGGDRFPTTCASALLGAKSADPEERERSIERIVAVYWKPAYKYTRLRWRTTPEQAEDITQEFFTKALGKDLFGGYEPSRARFRTFLRACLDRFVVDLDRRDRAAKRGGAAKTLGVDFADAEQEILASTEPPADALEEYFDAEWIRHVLTLAVGTLCAELDAKGKGEHRAVFERFHLARDGEEPSYADIARELGISVTDVTNRLSYARRELRRIVLDTLRSVTASDEEFRSEARAVLGVAA